MVNKAVHTGVTVEVGARKCQNYNCIAIKTLAIIMAFDKTSTHSTHIKSMFICSTSP